jgi:hypothetical protein
MGKILRLCDPDHKAKIASPGREIRLRAAVHGRDQGKKFFPVVLGRPAVAMRTRRAGISSIGLIGAGVEPPFYRLAVILVPDQPVQVDFSRAAFDAAFLQGCKTPKSMSTP